MEIELNNNDILAAGMYKYPMKDVLDYRPTPDNHQVALIKSSNQGDWVYGRFSIVDEDMIDWNSRRGEE